MRKPGQPSRLIYGYFLGWQYWDTAIIKYGIILLPLYLALCWWLTFQAMERAALGAAIERLPQRLRPLADFFSLWSRRYSVAGEPAGLRRWVVGVVIVLVAVRADVFGHLLDERAWRGDLEFARPTADLHGERDRARRA